MMVTRLVAVALKTSGSSKNTLEICQKILSVPAKARFLQNVVPLHVAAFVL